MSPGRDDGYCVKVTGLRWLAQKTFELRFARPADFNFIAGQKIGVVHKDFSRDYSLVGGPQEDALIICVRLIDDGMLTPVLSQARVGDVFEITPAFGQFIYRSDHRPAILVATGTGVAPFVAFARSGVKDFLLLHGVRSANERYYHAELAAAAKAHIACITGADPMGPDNAYKGRVTAYLQSCLTPKAYDFYLCGRREMIRDTMRIIDRQFPDARVFTEIFF